MNVLCIGNSFSQDATRYLHDIARNRGRQIDVANLYIGGCSLERHYRNMLSGEAAYEIQYNGHPTGFRVSLRDALLNREWNAVTIQQASHLSFKEESYVPYGEALAEFVRSIQPRTQLIVHQTWAYEDGSDRLRDIAGFETAKDMLAGIIDCYRMLDHTVDGDGFIPSGELLAKLIENGIPKVHRDTFHASLGLGRYALGLLWYRMLTADDAALDTFCDFDEPVSPAELEIVRLCVDTF